MLVTGAVDVGVLGMKLIFHLGYWRPAKAQAGLILWEDERT